jgi:hypothetical protein
MGKRTSTRLCFTHNYVFLSMLLGCHEHMGPHPSHGAKFGNQSN